MFLRNVRFRHLFLRHFFFAAGLLTLAHTLAAQNKPDVLVVRLGEEAARKEAILFVKPEYPPMARQLRITGSVVTEIVIGTDGKVEKVDIVSGHPLLVNAVKDATKKWKYPQKQVEGKPVELHFRFTFNFTI
jgi:TonB family protein